MAQPVKRCFCRCCVVWALSVSASAIAQPRLFWVEAGQDPSTQPAGTSVIFADPGTRVCVDIFVQGDASSFDSKAVNIKWEDDDDTGNSGSIQADCASLTIDTNRADYVGFDVTTVNTSQCTPFVDGTGALGAVFLNISQAPATLPPNPGGAYIATVCYDISADACGDFIINWLGQPDSETFIVDSAGSTTLNAVFSVLNIHVHPATVNCAGAAGIANSGATFGTVCVPPDCNGNGTPDQCDIANCNTAVDPSCGDCNLNGVPDGCDIAGGVSLDADMDGAPDECVVWMPDPIMPDDLWSTNVNWIPPIVPNNTVAQTFSVLIDVVGGTVNLDIDAAIDSLTLANAAAVSLKNVVVSAIPADVGNLTITTMTGIRSGGGLILTNGHSITSAGSITLKRDCLFPPPLLARSLGGCTPPFLQVSGGGLVSGTSLTILDSIEGLETRGVELSGLGVDRATITITGAVTLDSNGVYRKDPTVASPTDARLTSDSVLITNSLAGRGAMTLTDSMRVETTGDFVVSSSAGCRTFLLRGGCAPPFLRVLDSASIAVGGAFVVSGNVDVGFTSPPISAAAANTVAVIAPTLTIGGDVVIQSTTPTTFDWSTATIVMQGDVQSFEVAGGDAGLLSVGYVDNFAVGTLEIAPTSDVTFVDRFANAIGSEALYVDSLVLRAGSTVNLGDSPVYYRALINEGATINRSGAGDLIDTTCAGNSDCDDTDICTFDQCTGGACASVANIYGDVDFSGVVNVFDLFCVLDGFAGNFGVTDPDCTFERVNLEPCAGNSTINVFDLFAVLDAFSGGNPCCGP